MPNITTPKEFEKQFAELVSRIRTQATPFPKKHDEIKEREARKQRAKVDKFYFAAVYFPHYIQLNEQYLRNILKQPKGPLYISPDVEIDWVEAGFSPDHKKFFELTELKNEFVLLAAYRESSKDTLLGKIDAIHKMIFEECWFIPIIAFSHDHAATKVIPIKLEFENNERLKNDFGEMKGSVKWEEDEFIIGNGRKVKAYGRDESLRGQDNFGHRPDWIILNDVEDPTKTTNPALILKYVDSIRQDILKSVNSPRWGAILLCNYVSKQSIVHELMTGENTSHFNKQILRALVPNEKITKEDQEIAHQCRLHKYSDNWKSAWEFRHPTLRLLEEQKNDPDTFDAEMMMRPKDRKNKKFKDTDFKFYTRSQIAGLKILAYTIIDPSAKEPRDYKAIITMGVPMIGELMEIFILDAWIRQASVDEMLEETYRQHTAYQSKIIGVEMIGFAILLEREYIRFMKEKGYPLPILPIEKVDNKDARIEGLVPYVRNIMKFDPQQGDQGLLIRQFKAFPSTTQVSRGGIGDDGPDAVALGIRLIQDYPHGLEVKYESVKKREVVFEKGAF
jgi:predicted phage terminase large subunit-like protein